MHLYSEAGSGTGETLMPEESMVIHGESVGARSGEVLDVVNPATGESVGTIPRGTAADVDAAVQSAVEAGRQGPWSRLRPSERAELLYALAQVIRKRAGELAQAEMIDAGKPISQARGEVESAARYFQYNAGAVDKIGGSSIPVGPDAVDFTLREPWGVSAQIIPWNYPLHLAARGVAPALAMGNTVVLKPAEQASLTSLMLGRLALEAGLPPGVLNVVTGYGREAGAALAGHGEVNHVTFTGSVVTGTTIMKLAADNIVPVSLELGGKSPQIVFPDADLDRAIPAITRSLVVNAGQTCSAGTRVLVHEAVHGQVVDALTEAMAAVSVGLPQDDPDVGPLISEQQMERVLGYMELGSAEGLLLRMGGTRIRETPLAKGYFVSPTLFDHTPPTSRLFSEEIFGPVLCVTAFADAEEAIQLANATPYGLSTGIWTARVKEAFKLATGIRAGQIYINSFGIRENLGVPFGGYRKSGFGREKGLEALLGYSQVKNVAVSFD